MHKSEHVAADCAQHPFGRQYDVACDVHVVTADVNRLKSQKQNVGNAVPAPDSMSSKSVQEIEQAICETVNKLEPAQASQPGLVQTQTLLLLGHR